MKRITVLSTLFLGIVLLAAASVVFRWPQNLVSSIAYAAESGQAAAARAQLQASNDVSASFELAAKVIAPSVVSITSSHTVKAVRMQPSAPDWLGGWFGDEQQWMRRFFNEENLPHHAMKEQALGSGVIVSKDGYVLTNNHVVEGADRLTVQLSDNREFAAKLVGTDPKSDLAVLKISASDLTPAVLADSDAVQVGQWVLAVGSPFGLKESVTAGIVSAKGRANMGITDYEDFIQTDAAINQGNSGGPLINLKGEVIGINTAIVTRTGGFQGIGVAIPVDQAHRVMDELIKHGSVNRSHLGVVTQVLTPELAKSFNYSGKDGILLSEVQPNTPAAKAGLKAGDIVMAMDGKSVQDLAMFRNAIADMPAGTTVKLQVWRDGATQDIAVAVESMPGQIVKQADSGQHQWLGLELADPTPQNLERFDLGTGMEGAVIIAVKPGSPAEEAGLRPGDVIQQVQDTKVKTATDAADLLHKADLKQGIRVLARHGDMTRYVFLKIG